MKKRNFKRAVTYLVWGLLSTFFFAAAGNAQTTSASKKITGRIVVSPDDQPLEGASVVIKGSGIGTKTDKDGLYSLTAKEGDVLVISHIGYAVREETVGTRAVVNIRIEETNRNRLEDVVVIGYGQARRKDLTGAISSISGAEIMKSEPVTVDQALQGKVPGVIVQQVSGQPGGGVSVQIRGLSSFSNNPPLYVIDGVIVGSPAIDGSGTNPLSSINPSEIASIDVLKDASATAIYGSQATNGVVIITTKRGQTGPPKIGYDFYAGNQELMKYYQTMNLRDYATFMNEKAALIGYDLRPQFANPAYLGDGTNWQKALFRMAPMQNHSVSLSGGDSRTQYFLSGTYFDQEGIALGSDFKRLSVRLNIDNKTTNWLKIGTSLQLAQITEDVNATNSNVISAALTQTPDVAVKNPDGSWGGNDPNIYGAYAVNPFALATIVKDQKKRYQVFGNAYAEINFTQDLSLRNEVSGSFDFGTENQFTPTYTMGLVVNTVNSATDQSAHNFYTTIRNYLTYMHTFGTKLYVNVLAGHEAQLSTYDYLSAFRSNFPSNNVQEINSGDATTATNSGTASQAALESYYGRVNLSYRDKYLLTVNLRDDGSSNFAPGNRWVTTYSGAFAWRLSGEKFMEDVKALTDVKLRLGYGLTNNQNIGAYSYGATLNSVATGLSGDAQLTANLPNAGIKWETTNSFNIGMDANAFNGRITMSLDYYNRLTDGLLLSVPLPMYSGTIPNTGYAPGALAAPYENVGSVRNNGFDIGLSTVNIRSRNFSWRTNFTASHNINKVVSLNSEGDALYGYAGSNIAAKTVVGRPIGEFFGYQVIGMYRSGADFKAHPAIPDNSTTGVPLPITAATGGVWVGDLIFKDINKDGVIDENDQTFLGSPRPTWQLGLNNTFTYRNFDFTVFLTCNLGAKVLNEMNINGTDPNQNFGYFKSVLNYAKIAMIDPNGSATDVNNFEVTNPNTHIVRISQGGGNDNTRISDRYIESGNFVRFKTIALGYTLDSKLLSRAHLSAFRIFANVSNAFLITKYSGMDPEIGSYNPLLAGADNGYYPQPRVFTVGANISFNK